MGNAGVFCHKCISIASVPLDYLAIISVPGIDWGWENKVESNLKNPLKLS